jgi:hypothetical protein
MKFDQLDFVSLGRGHVPAVGSMLKVMPNPLMTGRNSPRRTEECS